MNAVDGDRSLTLGSCAARAHSAGLAPSGIAMRNFILALLGFVLCAGAAQAEPPLGLDHLIIYSRPGAPEQAALRAAGFTISPDVNHHDGQGTSSVTVEFSNGYLELLYPDAEVSVSDDMKAVAQIFRDRSNWRATGLSPLALQFHRTAATPAQFPFPTFKVHSEWMAPGQSLEMLTPRDMHNAMGLLITPTPVNAAENAAMAADPVKGQRFLHANGARRITDVRSLRRRRTGSRLPHLMLRNRARCNSQPGANG